MTQSKPRFDEAYWSKVIQRPDWYMEFVPYAKHVKESLGEESEAAEEFNRIVRRFFEEALENNRVALAAYGLDLDAQRQPIDIIVIHHTSAKPGYRLPYMNATQLLNIYAPYFMDPAVSEERNLKGTAIWSGHFRGGRPSFLVYHWLVRMDGSFERLLKDNELGWHAGNWDINKRSVGICLDNDYEQMCPTDNILQKIAEHIKNHYPSVKNDRIIGHREAREGTICPGAHFLSEWKSKLLQYFND